MSEASDLRQDPLTGRLTYLVGARQNRPNRPTTRCPFCPGGLEAPEPYDVRWFTNRWPALTNGRSEVVLYTPDHNATFWSLGIEGVRRIIDLWAERSVVLGAREDVDYVLIFENRGPDAGATISHAHGQIYAFDFLPELVLHELASGVSPMDEAPGGRVVSASAGWRAWVPEAPIFPYAVRLAPERQVPDLPSLDDFGRDGLAAALVDVLERFDRTFDCEAPYMLWIHQRPFDGGDWPDARLYVEIVSPWRTRGVMRYIAAGELGSGVYFNPIAPEVAAQTLRDARLPLESAVVDRSASDKPDE